MCPMVDSNSDCRHSFGVHYHEKLRMQVTSSYNMVSCMGSELKLYSFSSEPMQETML